jgi:hypothetical protein
VAHAYVLPVEHACGAVCDVRYDAKMYPMHGGRIWLLCPRVLSATPVRGVLANFGSFWWRGCVAARHPALRKLAKPAVSRANPPSAFDVKVSV